MKIYLHYNLWNKGAHVPWIAEGIRWSIPKGTVIDWTLENCTDKTEDNLMMCIYETGYGMLRDFDNRVQKVTKNYRWPNCNDAMRRFMESDCDLFLSPQDDQQIQDKHLIKNLEKIYEQAKQTGKKVGIVGMRDGVDGANFYFSSNFSKGTERTTWLSAGDFRKVKHVNDGPIALTKEVIGKVGYFDEAYWAHYSDQDYSYRCEGAGFQNYVLGSEIVHEKWSCKVCGEVQPSEVWSQKFSDHDYKIFLSKWGS